MIAATLQPPPPVSSTRAQDNSNVIPPTPSAAASSLVQEQQEQSLTVSAIKRESALDWYRRSHRKGLTEHGGPVTNSSLAWNFFRGPRTGIRFVDVAFQGRESISDTGLPILDIRGASSTGKTWSILTLAAHFVVATRAHSKTQQHGEPTGGQEESLPIVFLLDSKYDIDPSALYHVVRCTLLRKMETSINDYHFSQELNDCLARIQLASVNEATEWVAVLESIRGFVSGKDPDSPSLLLWDNFLYDASSSEEEATRNDIARQLQRVVTAAPVAVVTTSLGNRRACSWDKSIEHRLRLEKSPQGDPSLNPGSVASVQASRIPFSISSEGILS